VHVSVFVPPLSRFVGAVRNPFVFALGFLLWFTWALIVLSVIVLVVIPVRLVRAGLVRLDERQQRRSDGYY
jgi:hypothetical protein